MNSRDSAVEELGLMIIDLAEMMGVSILDFTGMLIALLAGIVQEAALTGKITQEQGIEDICASLKKIAELRQARKAKMN